MQLKEQSLQDSNSVQNGISSVSKHYESQTNPYNMEKHITKLAKKKNKPHKPHSTINISKPTIKQQKNMYRSWPPVTVNSPPPSWSSRGAERADQRDAWLHPCIHIHPCKITCYLKRKKTFLNMAPAEQCFILTWKNKSTPWGPFFYVKI